MLFLLEVSLVGVGNGEGDGKGDGEGDGEGDGAGDGVGDVEGDGGRGWAGDTGEGGGRGAFSSCSISFSSLIRPGGSTLYLDQGNKRNKNRIKKGFAKQSQEGNGEIARPYLEAIRPNSKRQRHTSRGCL